MDTRFIQSELRAENNVSNLSKKHITVNKPPQFINVSGKPPALGGTIDRVNLEEFMKTQKMEGWCEGVLVDPSLALNIANKQVLDPTKALEIKESIEKIQEDLIVSFMSPETGFGVFALKPIKKGSWIACYGSEIVSAKQYSELKDNSYLLGVNSANNDKIEAIYNPERHGNISRFFQHAFPQNDKQAYSVNQYIFNNSQIKLQVGVENLKIVEMVCEGYPIAFFQAKNDIDQHEGLFWNYGIDYWRAKDIIPALFTKSGKIIDSSEYRVEEIVLCINYKNAQARVAFTKTAAMAEFKNHDYLAVDGPREIAGKQTILLLGRDDMTKALSKYHGSFFVLFDKPSAVTYADLNLIEMLDGISAPYGIQGWYYNETLKIVSTSSPNYSDMRNLHDFMRDKVSCLIREMTDADQPYWYMVIKNPDLKVISEIEMQVNKPRSVI